MNHDSTVQLTNQKLSTRSLLHIMVLKRGIICESYNNIPGMGLHLRFEI